ncbi:hypothetical protein ABZP36_013809 [Zizania latifolia]
MPLPPSLATPGPSTDVDARNVGAAVTTTTGCLPADQSCFALSAGASSSPRYSTRRDSTTTTTTTRACCTTAPYIIVLGISFGSLLAVLLILCMIRWCTFVARRMSVYRRQDIRAADEAPPGSAKKRSAGLDANAIAALPEFTYDREEEDGGEEERECVVCLGTMANGEGARRLPRCMHLFHRSCVDVWLREHSTCPVCRAEVVVLRPAGGLRTEKVQESSTLPARVPEGMVDDGRERDLEAQ